MGMTTPKLAARGAMRDQALSAGTVGAIGRDMTQTQEKTMKTTQSKGINWVVVDDGKVISLHRERMAADRRAARCGGYVAAPATYSDPRLSLGVAVGQRCRVVQGAVYPV